VCTGCAPGRYGSAAGLTTSACSGLCAAGQYGALPGATSPQCDAPCPPGTFGADPGLASPTCSGNCTAGYKCAAGSTNSTAAICGPGTYSTTGAWECAPCSGGHYCPVAGSDTPTPSQYVCSAGFACPPQSVADAVVPCGSGYFCPRGTVNATGARCFASGSAVSAWWQSTALSGPPTISMVGSSSRLGPVAWANATGAAGGVDGDCSPTSYRLPVPIAEGGLKQVVLGDVSRDGLADAVFVLVNGSVGVSVQGGNALYGSLRLDAFVAGGAITSGSAGAVAMLDADTDGVVDVVVVGISGPSAVMVGLSLAGGGRWVQNRPMVHPHMPTCPHVSLWSPVRQPHRLFLVSFDLLFAVVWRVCVPASCCPLGRAVPPLTATRLSVTH
jgi:hypothetical protein